MVSALRGITKIVPTPKGILVFVRVPAILLRIGMRKLLVTIASCGVLMVACEPEYNPQSPSKEARTLENCEKAVTDIPGATKTRAEFDKRVKECMNG